MHAVFAVRHGMPGSMRASPFPFNTKAAAPRNAQYDGLW
jgi:hypothetical protein